MSEDQSPKQSPFTSQWSLTFEVRKRWGEASGVTTGESSQWSLTFEVRKRVEQARDIQRAHRVAMEPDL